MSNENTLSPAKGHFADRLCLAVKGKGTPLVVGLDPVFEYMPPDFRDHCADGGADVRLDSMVQFCGEVIRVVAALVPAVKINIAFFERYLWRGVEAYYRLIELAASEGLIAIGDVKRGDIGHTAEQYAVAHLSSSGPDAITINGFAGSDGITAFADIAARNGKGIFVWVRSSNPSAAEIQDFADVAGTAMYQRLAATVDRIASQPQRLGPGGWSNVGMVVGGTSPAQTAALRRAFPHMWFLVPGYGSQKATAADCMRFCKPDGTGALINASRSIIYAHDRPPYRERFGGHWKKAVRQSVLDTREDLAAVLQ